MISVESRSHVWQEARMNTLKSKDGTTIAFDKAGGGPAVILVDGAMTSRSDGSKPELARLLAEHLTVYTYDRRRPLHDAGRNARRADRGNEARPFLGKHGDDRPHSGLRPHGDHGQGRRDSQGARGPSPRADPADSRRQRRTVHARDGQDVARAHPRRRAAHA